MVETSHKLIVDQGRRSRSDYRRWTDEQKWQIVAETYAPGTSISVVARRHDVNANQLFQWRKKFKGESGALKEAGFVPVGIVSGADAVAPGPTHGVIAIELRGGIIVRVDSNVDEEALSRVLSVIGRLP